MTRRIAEVAGELIILSPHLVFELKEFKLRVFMTRGVGRSMGEGLGDSEGRGMRRLNRPQNSWLRKSSDSCCSGPGLDGGCGVDGPEFDGRYRAATPDKATVWPF
jgi:hypothetical protein